MIAQGSKVGRKVSEYEEPRGHYVDSPNVLLIEGQT